MATIIVPSAIPTLSVGGRVFTDLANLLTLSGYCAGGASPRTSFRKPATSAGYAPSGKTFVVKAIRLNTATTAAASPLSIFYSDNDCGIGSATAATNQVYMAGASSVASLSQGAWVVATTYEFALNFVIPAGKFVGMENGGTFSAPITIFGYEV